jgi:hypothetical protein
MKELVARGIVKSDPGRIGKKVRLPGFKNSQRAYVVSSSALFDDSEASR